MAAANGEAISTSLNNAGTINETSTKAFANYAALGSTADNSNNGPLRVGVFAKSGSSRGAAGAGYYGMMELSGNLTERAVTVGNTTARSFTGVNGNGVLSINGNADQTSWPGLNSGEVTGATGAGQRAGHWGNPTRLLRTSDREYASYGHTSRGYESGGRGVRSVP